MKLTEILSSSKPVLSFEVFPPKKWENFEEVESATSEIAALSPSYMSVTYRAGGEMKYTVPIAASLQKSGIPTVAHLTCATLSREGVRKQLREIQAAGIENVLAMRGDCDDPTLIPEDSFHHANELIEDIRKSGADLCIGGACYPEGHPESSCQREDILNLKRKVDAGCDFLVTQMFFDNNILYNFLYKAREAGITVPICAGIFPVVSANQIKRICSISGNALPSRFLQITDKFGSSPEAMRQAGVAYAVEQIVDLYANDVHAIHVYSMNKPDVARDIKNALDKILGADIY